MIFLMEEMTRDQRKGLRTPITLEKYSIYLEVDICESLPVLALFFLMLSKFCFLLQSSEFVYSPKSLRVLEKSSTR